MPVQSWAHSHYWAGTQAPDGPPPAAGASARGGYTPWMTTVIVGSLFGVLQVAYEWAMRKARG